MYSTKCSNMLLDAVPQTVALKILGKFLHYWQYKTNGICTCSYSSQSWLLFRLFCTGVDKLSQGEAVTDVVDNAKIKNMCSTSIRESVKECDNIKTKNLDQTNIILDDLPLKHNRSDAKIKLAAGPSLSHFISTAGPEESRISTINYASVPYLPNSENYGNNRKGIFLFVVYIEIIRQCQCRIVA